MKRPEEIAFYVDPMCGLYTASFTRLSKEFWFRDRKELSRGKVSSSGIAFFVVSFSHFLAPDGDDESLSSSLK
jgi:hypothetical protein